MKRARIALLVAISGSAACAPAAASDAWPAVPALALEQTPVRDREEVSFVQPSSRSASSFGSFSLADLPHDDPPPLSTFRIPLPTTRKDADRSEVMISHGDQALFYTNVASIQPVVGALLLPCGGPRRPVTEARLFWQAEGVTFASGGGLVWEIAKGFYNPNDCELYKASHTWTTMHELVPELIWGAKRSAEVGHEVTLIVLDAVSVVTSHDLGPDARATVRLGATLGPQAFARVTLAPELSRARISIAAVLRGTENGSQTLVSIELHGSNGQVFTTVDR